MCSWMLFSLTAALSPRGKGGAAEWAATDWGAGGLIGRWLYTAGGWTSIIICIMTLALVGAGGHWRSLEHNHIYAHFYTFVALLMVFNDLAARVCLDGSLENNHYMGPFLAF